MLSSGRWKALVNRGWDRAEKDPELPESDRELLSGEGADHGLIHQCRALNWAMFSAWRWRQADQMPDRNHWRVAGLNHVRAALDRCWLG